jgi:hypothetical protein
MKSNTIIYNLEDWDGLSTDKITELGNSKALDKWMEIKLDELWLHICKTNKAGDRIIINGYGCVYEDFHLHPDDVIKSA